MSVLITLTTRLSTFPRLSTRFGPVISRRVAEHIPTRIASCATISTQSRTDIDVETPECPLPTTISDEVHPPFAQVQPTKPTRQKTKRRPDRPVLKTLRPDWMAATGQETSFLYPSGRIYYRTALNDFLDVGPLTSKQSPLSLGKKGVLYYHQDPTLSELAGEVRFRYCDTVDEFDLGEDHMLTPVRPWSIRLPIIAHYKRHLPLRKLIVAEQLVAQDLVEDLAQIPLGEGAYLYQLEQPFLFELRHPRMDCCFITRNATVQCHFEGLYKDYRIRRSPSRRFEIPYSGVIRVRWEVSRLPQHKDQGPTLVLRILENVTPIKTLIPDYDGYFPVPEPGTLVSRKIRNRDFEPCAFTLQKRANGPEILDFIQRTSPEILDES